MPAPRPKRTMAVADFSGTKQSGTPPSSPVWGPIPPVWGTVAGQGATPVLTHLPRGTVGKHPPSPLAVRLAAERPSPQPEVLGCPPAAKGAAVLPPYPEMGQRQGGHLRVRLRRGTTAETRPALSDERPGQGEPAAISPRSRPFLEREMTPN